MVTKKSSKKRDLEHYGLSDEIDVFFTFLPPVLKKGHLFLSFFENPALDLKKRNIITSSASALPILRRGL
jgi:hypothetical protein